MRNFAGCFLLFLASSGSAAVWKQVGAPDSYVYYSEYDPSNQLFDRVIQLSEARVTDSAIIMGSYLASSLPGFTSVSCQKLLYLGEMETTFVFQYSEGIVKIQDEDTVKSIRTPKTVIDKAISMYVACAFSNEYKNPLNVYIPSRFASLDLPGIFQDATIKLVRLTNTGIRPEFTP